MTAEDGPFPWIEYPSGVRDPAGNGINGVTYFVFDNALDTSSVADSVRYVRLSDTGDIQADVPVKVQWVAKGGFVVVTPEEPLTANSLHAVIMSDKAKGLDGRSISAPALLEDLKAGRGSPQALQDRFDLLWKKVDRSPVRAATVFRSGAPLEETRTLAAYVRRRTPPMTSGLVLAVNDPTFCAVEGSVSLPLFQAGEKPYVTNGEIKLASSGLPLTETVEQVHFAVSIPHGIAPPGGYPVVIFSHGLNSNYHDFIDRGIAKAMAVSKFAVLSADAPLFGPRHPLGDPSGKDFLARSNPIAARDNVRQLAMDAVSLALVPTSLVIPAGMCDPSESRFDGQSVFFWGHQIGAQAGVIALSVSNEIHGAFFSGISTDIFGDFTEERAEERLLAEPTDPLLWARTWSKPTLVNSDNDYIASLKGAAPATEVSLYSAPTGVSGAVFFEQPKAQSMYRCYFEAIAKGQAPDCPFNPQ